MSIKKKIAAALCALTLVVSLSACSTDLRCVGEINGKDVTAGTYILGMVDGWNSAKSKMTELGLEGDLFDQEFDGKSAEKYIEDYAVRQCKYYAAINDKFDEMGLTLSQADKQAIELNTQNEMSILTNYYKDIGVAETSLKYKNTTVYKKDKIVDALYGEGGTEEIPEAELKQTIADNYSRVRLIPVVIGTTTDATEEDKQKALDEAKDKLEGYKERIENGAAFMDIYDEYMKESKGSSYQVSEEDLKNEYRGETVLPNIYVMSKENSDKILEMKDGEMQIIVDGEKTVFLVQKYDILEREDLVENYKKNAISILKLDEFNESIYKIADTYDFDINDKVFDEFDPCDVDPNKMING